MALCGGLFQCFKAPYVGTPVRAWIHYGIDWLIVIALLVIIGLFERVFTPFERVFVLDDSSLAMPYQKRETVPFVVMIAVLFGVSILVFGAFATRLKNFHDFHKAFFGLLQTFVFVTFVTEVVKHFSGRLRPDWYARCEPTMRDDVIVCTGDSELWKDGRMSFFSGHASIAWGLCTFLSMYMCGKLRLMDKRGHFWRVVVTCAPLVFALFVAISRTMDYRHHWEDVVVGSLVGLFFGICIYRQHYPNPFTHCTQPDAPYPLYTGPVIGHHEPPPEVIDLQAVENGDFGTVSHILNAGSM